jgi:hypothetical protein
MNNADLDKVLKAARVPNRDSDYWNDFPRRVLAEARRRPLPTEAARTRWTMRLAWGASVATACVLLGFALGHWRGQSDARAANGLLQNSKVIQEVMMLFPNRVRAVIQEGDSFRVVLAEEANVPASTPLWVKICHGDKCVALVTFSGQELEVAGQQLTVLASAEGGVIVLGDRFAWASDGAKGGLQDLKIQARALEFASIR